MTKSPKIAIIILNWNGKQDTLACLDSLEKLSYPHFEVIVIDNGSTDGSSLAIRQHYPQHMLIENQTNLGFAEGNNIGMRKAMQRKADMLFLLNNDTVVAEDILDRFVEIFDSYPEAGILGAKIYRFDQKQTIDHLGGMWNPKTATFTFVGLNHQDNEEKFEVPQPLDYVCGAGLIIRCKVIETIGYLDPRFFLIWEESDYCFQARKAGFKVLTCPQAKLWHKVSASFVGGKQHSTYFWWRNRLLWIEKNCTPREKISLYFRILIPDCLHLMKIDLLKNPQLFFAKSFQAKKHQEKKEKFFKNRAALCGIRDYLMRRFGKGPDWIYKKNR